MNSAAIINGPAEARATIAVTVMREGMRRTDRTRAYRAMCGAELIERGHATALEAQLAESIAEVDLAYRIKTLYAVAPWQERAAAHFADFKSGWVA